MADDADELVRPGQGRQGVDRLLQCLGVEGAELEICRGALVEVPVLRRDTQTYTSLSE